MMMAYGLFVFTLSTVPYQEFKRQVSWRFASNSRVGMRPSRQFLGPDEEPITLSGVLLPELSGGRMSLKVLELLGSQGKAWPLIEGSGMIYGMYTLESLETTSTVFFSDGRARRVEFSATFKRADNYDLRLLGLATSALGGLAGNVLGSVGGIAVGAVGGVVAGVAGDVVGGIANKVGDTVGKVVGKVL
ncbi:phage tail protein [Pandoraea fibrosis]|uniref:Phage tail protein n=1 Tax=Pandoraea fibrosis TaxID=1891094 RepID=A0A5E4SVM7_9BURK|nr:phage tail protein [Pandoraea fibrosis]